MTWMAEAYGKEGYLEEIAGEVPRGETEMEMGTWYLPNSAFFHAVFVEMISEIAFFFTEHEWMKKVKDLCKGKMVLDIFSLPGCA